MQNRWAALAVLTLVRLTMGVQFQAVPAVSLIYLERYGVDLSQLGLLIALYLSPGLVIAFPGGALAARFGTVRVIRGALVLIVLGSALMAMVPTWEGQLLGRVLGGFGGITINVVMTKLVSDRFAGKEISTAMAIYVNSWPIGIALTLIALPPFAAAYGLDTALMAVAGVMVAGLLLFYLGYVPQETDRPGAAGQARERLTGRPLAAICVAGLVWGTMNAALGTIFSFGPALLDERGFPLAAGAAVTSIPLWLASIAVPLGGILADVTGRKDLMLVLAAVIFAAALGWAAAGGPIYLSFILLGLFGALGAGPIMSLPSEVLTPGTSAKGMGIFYTIFYVFTVFTPVLSGVLSDWFATATAAFWFGAVMSAFTAIGFRVFRMIVPRQAVRS